MKVNTLILIVILGFIGAFIAGLVGLGGGIIMLPLLYFVPPLVTGVDLSMKVVAGITVTQVLVATGTAFLVHRSNNFINYNLVKWMGSSIVVGSFLGGMASEYVDEKLLQIIFASLALISAIMMFVPKKDIDIDSDLEKIEFNKILAAIYAFVVGVLAGLIGAGGSFILIPIMLYILKIPLRITIGSSLGIVFFSALASFLGKVITGQIVWEYALIIILGAVPGARVGGILSKKVSNKVLKILLAILITASAVKMWLNII